MKSTAYERAKKKVKRIKGFYKHLTVYLIVNAVIVLEGFRGLDLLKMSEAHIDPAFLEWLFWNVLSVPVLWGIGLMIHGIRVFVPGMQVFRQWEERQVRKFMEKEERTGMSREGR